VAEGTTEQNSKVDEGNLMEHHRTRFHRVCQLMPERSNEIRAALRDMTLCQQATGYRSSVLPRPRARIRKVSLPDDRP